MKPPINLSRATRLEVVQFWCGQLSAEWIVMTLQTVTHKHRDLQRILFHIPYYHTIGVPSTGIRKQSEKLRTNGGWTSTGWSSGSGSCIQFAQRSRTLMGRRMGGREGGIVSCLLLEITKRGVIDLVKDKSVHDRKLHRKSRSVPFVLVCIDNQRSDFLPCSATYSCRLLLPNICPYHRD